MDCMVLLIYILVRVSRISISTVLKIGHYPLGVHSGGAVLVQTLVLSFFRIPVLWIVQIIIFHIPVLWIVQIII